MSTHNQSTQQLPLPFCIYEKVSYAKHLRSVQNSDMTFRVHTGALAHARTHKSYSNNDGTNISYPQQCWVRFQINDLKSRFEISFLNCDFDFKSVFT